MRPHPLVPSGTSRRRAGAAAALAVCGLLGWSGCDAPSVGPTLAPIGSPSADVGDVQGADSNADPSPGADAHSDVGLVPGVDVGPDTVGDVADDTCAPSCDGRACGDDGCGGACGTCDDGATCSDGACTPGPAGPCSPAGPYGTSVGDTVADATLTDCEGVPYRVHDLCEAPVAWIFSYADW